MAQDIRRSALKRQFQEIVKKAEEAEKKKNSELAEQYYRQAALLYERIGETYSPSERERRAAVAQKMRAPEVGQRTERVEGGELRDRVEEAIASTRPEVTWDDIGGLEETKEKIRLAVNLSRVKRRPDQDYIEPWRGVLLYGPPGTGKTLLAQATAAGYPNMTFFEASADKLLSKYFGESPQLIAQLFKSAREKSPSFVFMDEIDGIAISRSRGESHEESRRALNQLLQETQALRTAKEYVLFMAGTNTPWTLDEAQVSRFQVRVYVPPPDQNAREVILRIRLKSAKLQGVTLQELARRTEGYSGRDIANVVQSAIMRMVKEENPGLTRLSEAEVDRYALRTRALTLVDFEDALRNVKPTINREMLRRFESWEREHDSGLDGGTPVQQPPAEATLPLSAERRRPAVEQPIPAPKQPLAKRPTWDRPTVDPGSVEVFLGMGGDGARVAWRPFSEANPHLVVEGFSGTGKTESCRTIIKELDRLGVPVIIFDMKGGTFQLGNVIDLKNVTVNPLDLDYDSSRSRGIEPRDKVTNLGNAIRVIFGLGDIQVADLKQLFIRCYEKRGIYLNKPETWNRECPSFADLQEILDQAIEEAKGPKRQGLEGIKGRLFDIFLNEFFSAPTSLTMETLLNRGIATIDMRSLAGEGIRETVAEVLIQKILGYIYALGPTRAPRFFLVLDEGHRLARSPGLELLAREAREFGVGIILASQFLRDFKKEVVGNISTKLVFHTEPVEEADYVARAIGVSAEVLQNDLRGPGQGIVRFGSQESPVYVKFVPWDERRGKETA